MRIVFGGHIDEFDIHHIGFDDDSLREVLLRAGFARTTRVDDFGVFNDTSRMTIHGTPISLNLIAYKAL